MTSLDLVTLARRVKSAKCVSVERRPTVKSPWTFPIGSTLMGRLFPIGILSSVSHGIMKRFPTRIISPWSDYSPQEEIIP